ncbi:olfactory receptor-like protein OLF4 [Molossus molossus]|uniref:olfactory receptor-like protein OLF4 n=1 Tax=Molossus molossus TaxID=27622 RepID=UPI0017465004|nr:olfactory receptor-like protein OLF4 [Molossus molossus]
MYLITVLGNLLIILAVSSDSHLHTPMYFFLSNLSLVDICFTSTTVPKMLWNIQTQSKLITYEGCIAQIYFFILFAVLDDFLLTVMAYDRFMAICHPLHYTVVMNPRLCGLMVLVCWIIIVSLFYGTSLGVYLSSAATNSSYSSTIASVIYAVVTPMLNPFIYSLRNKDIKRAMKRFFVMVAIKKTTCRAKLTTQSGPQTRTCKISIFLKLMRKADALSPPGPAESVSALEQESWVIHSDEN